MRASRGAITTQRGPAARCRATSDAPPHARALAAGAQRTMRTPSRTGAVRTTRSRNGRAAMAWALLKVAHRHSMRDPS
ncbi:hypothetical protein WK25_17295 [Burkholderia latens]|nr:hypothetical protein WK25_17295 [Burkholderia latens]